MTKQSRPLTFSADYEFGEENILTAAHFEEIRRRNQHRIEHAQSVLDTEAEHRIVNNSKRIQQEQDREREIDERNQMLLLQLERIHKKVPKRFDVSHHTEEHLNAEPPSNFPRWQREQERIAEENKKIKRRLNQTTSMFNTKQLAKDADKYRLLSEQLSKADRRMHVKQKYKHLERQRDAIRSGSHSRSPSKTLHRRKRNHYHEMDEENEQHMIEGVYECHPDQFEARKSYELPRVRGSYKVESKYAASQESFPTVTNTTKLVRASDLLPRLGR